MKRSRDYRADARTKMKGKWGYALLGVVIYGLVFAAMSFTGILALLFGLPLTIGLLSYLSKLYDTGRADVGNLFDGFKDNLVNRILASVLKYLFVALWSLLFVIPGIIKTYSYAMTEYLMMQDSTLDANAAITKSRTMMDGNKGRLFLLDLSFIGWIILCGLTFGILYLYVAPYMLSARLSFYEDLYERTYGGRKVSSNENN
ncbi:MAG: DUF975 family protein [Erysipelotrichaceae bacterium]|jgi:uncharacterized membrane protein|nr:DUF975 family protein [Erysipelotrichaceae bacterium]